MRTIEFQSDLIFVVENLFRTEKETVHAQGPNPCSTQQPNEGVSKGLMGQAEYLRTSQKKARDLHDVRIRDGSMGCWYLGKVGLMRKTVLGNR